MLLKYLSFTLLLTPAALLPSGKPAKTLREIRAEIAAERAAANTNNVQLPRSSSYAIGGPAAHRPMPASSQQNDQKEEEKKQENFARPLPTVPNAPDTRRVTESTAIGELRAKAQQEQKLPESPNTARPVEQEHKEGKEGRNQSQQVQSRSEKELQALIDEVPELFYYSKKSGPLFDAFDQNDLEGIKACLTSPFDVDDHDLRMLIPYIIRQAELTDAEVAEIKNAWPELLNKIEQIDPTLPNHERRQTCEKIIGDIARKIKPLQLLLDLHNDLAASGFNLLMKAAAAGKNEIVNQSLHANFQPRRGWEALVGRPLSWMAARNATINERELVLHLTKDRRAKPDHIASYKRCVSLATILDPEALKKKHPILQLVGNMDALQLAALGAHTDIIATLIDELCLRAHREHVRRVGLGNPEHYVGEYIHSALQRLIYWSDVIETNLADELFTVIGISAKPNMLQYEATAAQLIQALLQTKDTDQRYYTGNFNTRLRALLEHIMQYGSNEVFHAIASSLASVTTTEINWDEQALKKILEQTLNGEKLTILLGITAPKDSIIQIFRDALLNVVEKNPLSYSEYVERARNYIVCREKIENEIGNNLLPDLANIVQGYVQAPQLPTAEIRQRVLGIEPKKKILILRLQELTIFSTLPRSAIQVREMINLLKEQPYTPDVLKLIIDLLNDIKANARTESIQSVNRYDFPSFSAQMDSIREQLQSEIEN